MKYFPLLGFVLFSVIGYGQISKSQTIDWYKSLYLTTALEQMDYVKGTACDPGKIAEHIYQKAEDRINFFRQVNGLHAVKINSKFNGEAQAAAHWCSINNHLDHFPQKGTKCFSDAAYNGCSKSCLGFTDFEYFKSTAFISGFIQDFGESNYFVGHRRCILASNLESFGYGATANTEALHVIAGMTAEPDTLPEFIAYPWHGYVPVDLIYAKWSFSIPQSVKADLKDAVVIMRDGNGKSIALHQYKFYSYMDPTIVWRVDGMFTKEEIEYGKNGLEEKGFVGQRITVEVKNVLIEGKRKDYNYFVEIIPTPKN